MANVLIANGQTEELLATAFSPVVTLSELVKNASDACLVKKDTIRVKIDTIDNKIIIEDNGKGFSLSDIEDLKTIGLSRKMKATNTLSSIGEPYAGSKGLGVLTVFNICNELRIDTYSHEDKKSYSVTWVKGTETVEHHESDDEIHNTTITLLNVDSESLTFITQPDELEKLAMSSITYYESSESLPLIELYKDGELVAVRPEFPIEDFYQRNRTKRREHPGRFVIKAAFKYEAHKLTISFDDNEKGTYGFENVELNLTDKVSLKSFAHQYKALKWRIDDCYESYNPKYNVPPFEGVFYVWRDKKGDFIDFPYGVRVYTNNYGLYHYLNKDTDWLGLSEISQNIKATNLKLKNTYGFVHFKEYNEDECSLKISKERNDFLESMSKINFMTIMRKAITGIVSAIDMEAKETTKDKKERPFKARLHIKEITPGTAINIKDLITSPSAYESINVSTPDGVHYNQETGDFTFDVNGDSIIGFKEGEDSVSVTVRVAEPAPYFELKRKKATTRSGETLNLDDFINRSSLKHATIADIIISCDTAAIKQRNLAYNASVGSHTVKYLLESAEIQHLLDVEVIPLHQSEARRLKALFGNYTEVKDPVRVVDLIDDIASCYMSHPTLCACGLRVILEVSAKAYLHKVIGIAYDEADCDSITSYINRIKKILSDTDSNIKQHIKDKYKQRLTKAFRTAKKTIEQLDFNEHHHGIDAFTKPSDIEFAVKQLKIVFAFIFDSLIDNQKQES